MRSWPAGRISTSALSGREHALRHKSTKQLTSKVGTLTLNHTPFLRPPYVRAFRLVQMDKIKDPKIISGLVGLLLGAAAMLFGAEYVDVCDCEKCDAEEASAGETGEG